MRAWWVALGVAVVAGAPDAARACSGYCGDDGRFFAVSVETRSPVPRDGALVVYAVAAEELCFSELEPHVRFEVWHGAASVSGRVEFPGGLGQFVFVPDDPWLPEAEYQARLTIDNTGLGPGSLDWCGATEDLIVEAFEFKTSAEFSPPLPELPPPAFSASTWPINDNVAAIACCPAVVPESDDSAGCFGLIQWFDGDCAYLFEETALVVEAGEFTVPAALQGQVLYELYLDGVLAGRSTDLELFGAWTGRSTCASMRATHLGTRVQVESPTVCVPAAMASALGVHARDVAAELPCAGPQVCAAGGGWDPEACVPFDPQAFPPAPAPAVRESRLESDCPGLGGIGKPPGDGASEGGASSGSGEGSQDDGLERGGCGCAQSPGAGGLLGLLGCLVGAFSRGGRRATRRCAGRRG